MNTTENVRDIVEVLEQSIAENVRETAGMLLAAMRARRLPNQPNPGKNGPLDGYEPSNL